MALQQTPRERWDLEEIPYETGGTAGGWYLRFDPTSRLNEDVLYMSRAHVTPEQARLIAAAPALRDLLQQIVDANNAAWPSAAAFAGCIDGYAQQASALLVCLAADRRPAR